MIVGKSNGKETLNFLFNWTGKILIRLKQATPALCKYSLVPVWHRKYSPNTQKRHPIDCLWVHSLIYVIFSTLLCYMEYIVNVDLCYNKIPLYIKAKLYMWLKN